MSRSSSLLLLAALGGALGLSLVACGGAEVSVGSKDDALKNGGGSGSGAADGGSAGVCTVDGTTYAAGQSFLGPDGCNHCTCQPSGEAVCTELACAPVDGGSAPVCFYDGKGYAAGDSFPSSDGCNSCACQASGDVVCTEKACAYTCPPDGGIDCMPPVPAAKSAMCSGPYHQWIVANCPGVGFVY